MFHKNGRRGPSTTIRRSSSTAMARRLAIIASLSSTLTSPGLWRGLRVSMRTLYQAWVTRPSASVSRAQLSFLTNQLTNLLQAWISSTFIVAFDVQTTLTTDSPYKFEAPWHAFEFAFHVLESYSNLVIISMAWMTREDGRAYSRTPLEPDLETLTYWVTRLEPLIRSDNQDEIIVVFCNRTGTEGNATYAGTSAVVGILDGEVRVYGMLGRGEKNLLVVDTNNPPRAKMVYRPEGEEDIPHEHPSEETKSSHSRTTSNAALPGSPALSAPRSSSNRQNPPPSPRPPIPPPAPTRESVRGSSQSRQRNGQPASNRDLHVDTSRRRKEDDDGGIPTPSAPSPTPMAIRPKITIPDSAKSPSSQAMDDFSEPPSAISLRSQASTTSSVLSRASESTVRSTARAPEDSTPYPHSGIPINSAAPFSPQRQVFGGTVTFEDPEIAATWTPSPQLSRTPEAFKWPPQRPRPEGETAQERERKVAARMSGASVGSDATSKFYSSFTAGESHSRSASRNHTRDGGSSNMGMMDPVVSFAQQTAHLIPRGDAAERIRGLAQSDSPIPERPSSPKSRNASRSRPTAASPELQRRGTASPELQRSQSAAIQIFASASIMGEGHADRGRQPEPSASWAKQDNLARSGSTPPDIQHPIASSSNGYQARPPSQAERRPSLSQRRSSSAQMHDFVRIEEVPGSKCPVHGDESRSGSGSDGGNGGMGSASIPVTMPGLHLAEDSPAVPTPLQEAVGQGS